MTSTAECSGSEGNLAAFFRRIFGRRTRLSEEFLLDQLEQLELLGERFEPDDARVQLQAACGIEVPPFHALDTRVHLEYEAERLERGFGAGLYRNPVTESAHIFLPLTLRPAQWCEAAYHELAHVALRHPMPRERLFYDAPPGEVCAAPLDETAGCMGEKELDLWHPTTGLTRRRAPDAHVACEQEAREWADFFFVAGICGEKIYSRKGYFFS